MRWCLHNSGLQLCQPDLTFVSSGANSHQGQGSGARDGGRDGEAEGGWEVWRRGAAAHDLQPSPWWDSPAQLLVGWCSRMLLKYFKRPRQLVLSQLGGVGACRQVRGGHIIHLCNTCSSCASSPPSVTQQWAPTSSSLCLWQFFCPPSQNWDQIGGEHTPELFFIYMLSRNYTSSEWKQ